VVEKQYKVGDLAKVAGKTVRALHLYEELGLLRPISRSAGGYRLYTDEAVSRVRWIARMQDMGFSLPEIQDFLKNWEDSANGPLGMGRVRAVFEAKLAETRDTVTRLKALERELQASLAYLDLCGTCEPSHTQKDCGCCEQPGHDPARTPDLVSGLARPHGRPDVPLGHLMTEGNR
jgi:DNA-binding transcriptional MerR regulator